MATESYKALLVKNKRQFFVLTAMLIVFFGSIALLYLGDGTIFQRFIGDLNPIIFGGLVSTIAFFVLSLLIIKNWFFIYRKISPRRLFRYFLIVLVFVLLAVLVDWNIMYPENMNIPFPESLLFYPVMGFVVEILFHLLPLTILLYVFTFFFKNMRREKLTWAAILIVALLEPTYQIYMDAYPAWAMVLVWTNLFFFNVLQLVVFSRHGFINMYSLRFVYYLFWHIIWGSLRLELLF